MATHHPDLRVIERELAEIDFSELTALHLIVGIYKNQEQIMADIIALQDAVNKLTQSEVAASNELAVLVSKIGNLSAGTISQDQIDDLAAQVTSVADALTSATNAAQDAVPGDDAAPVEANGDGVSGVWHVYEGETQATSTE